MAGSISAQWLVTIGTATGFSYYYTQPTTLGPHNGVAVELVMVSHSGTLSAGKGIQVFPEFSTDLVTWDTNATGTTATGVTLSPHRVMASFTDGPSGSNIASYKYVRLRVANLEASASSKVLVNVSATLFTYQS